MSVLNRLKYFFRRRWTASGNHHPRGAAVRHRAQRVGAERYGAPERSDEQDSTIGPNKRPPKIKVEVTQDARNGYSATQDQHNSAAATGEMNEAAQAVDTFYVKNKRTKQTTSKGGLPRVSEISGWCPACTDGHGRTEKREKRKTRKTMPFLQGCVELLLYVRTYSRKVLLLARSKLLILQ